MLQSVKNITAQTEAIRTRNVTTMGHKSVNKQNFDTKPNLS